MDIHSDIRTDVQRARHEVGYAVDGDEHSLHRLHYWLKYEGMSGGLFFASFWVPAGLVAGALYVLALVFTPYMIWHLAKAGWYRAITLFSAFVLLPFVVSRILPSDGTLGRFLIDWTPLIVFYIFTWILRLLIGEHLSERRAIRDIEYRREYR
jgi:hypothetical protein